MTLEDTDFTEHPEQTQNPDPDIMREISTFLDTCSMESECHEDLEDFLGNVEEELISSSQQKQQLPVDLEESFWMGPAAHLPELCDKEIRSNFVRL